MNRRTFLKLSASALMLAMFNTEQREFYMVSDEYKATEVLPDWFNIKIDDNKIIKSLPEILPNGSKRLHYNMADISDTEHTFKVSAVSEVKINGKNKILESPPIKIRYRVN